MRESTRARLLGLLLLPPIPLALWALPRDLAFTLGALLGLVALFFLVATGKATVPARDLTASVRGDAALLRGLRQALQLRGRPVYAVANGRGQVFYPSRDKNASMPQPGTAPALESGLLLPAVGWGMLQAQRRTAGVPAATDIEAAEDSLRAWAAEGDLARRLHVTKGDAPGGGYVARFRSASVAPPCLDRPQAPDCVATGCHLCQAIGCSLAAAAGRPIVVTDARISLDQVTLRFEETT